MKYLKREVVEAERREVEAISTNSFYRRTSLNRRLGMTARNPYAFQLTDEELTQAEQDVRDGNLPVPHWTEPNGLRILGDPFREALRRHVRDGLPEGDRRRYIEGKYASQILH